MKKKIIFLFICISSLPLLSFEHNTKTIIKENEPSTVNFYTGNYDDFLREAKKQKKGIILDFWASWCTPCKKMENETFSDENLIQYLNENFMTYKVNIDTFDGSEIAQRFSVDSFPTLLVLDNKGKYVSRLKGFFPANYLMNELQKTKNLKNKK